jgi:thiol:disulfide interchange protein
MLSGIVVAALVLTGCGRPGPPPAAVVEPISTHATVKVEWERDLPSALERARNEDKPVLITFYADWCVWCKRFESTTLRDAQVASMLSDRVVPLSLNVDGAGKELSYEYRVDGLPTILVLDAGGRELGRIPGYMPPQSFLARIDELLQQG